MGDGESGRSGLEAAMTAAHYKLDNVCALVDYNNLQIDKNVKLLRELPRLKKNGSPLIGMSSK